MSEGREDERQSYYLTTAISYVNGPPHLGHAYEAISTDAMARFKRLDGPQDLSVCILRQRVAAVKCGQR